MWDLVSDRGTSLFGIPRKACSCNGVVLPRKAHVGSGPRPGNKSIQHSPRGTFVQRNCPPTKSSSGTWSPSGEQAYSAFPARHVRATELSSHEKPMWDLVSDRGTSLFSISRTARSCNGVVLPRTASVGPGLRPGNKSIQHSPHGLFVQQSCPPTKSSSGTWSPTGEQVYSAFPARHVRATKLSSHEKHQWDLVPDRGTSLFGTPRTAC